MKEFDFEKWDDDRITVNAAYSESLRAGGLTAFADFMQNDIGEVAKNLLKERTTVRLSLPGLDGPETDFFLKRHRTTPWKEYVKPWFRLTRPIIGARNEWNAILEFERASIPTMTPVALGERGRESFLLTEGIPCCRKLSDWMHLRFDRAHSPCAGGMAPPQQPASKEAASPLHDEGWLGSTNGSPQYSKRLGAPPRSDPSHPVAQSDSDLTAIVEEIAGIARQMHAHGLHHQDFYLTHLLLPTDDRRRGIHVIDLGRARKRRRLSRRWIVKDLAQLNYSADLFPGWTRERFLQHYLNRPLRKSDRGFLNQIERKTARIARHSAKHCL